MIRIRPANYDLPVNFYAGRYSNVSLKRSGPKWIAPNVRDSVFCYQITLSANWICLALVVVELMKPATSLGAPVSSKISVLSGAIGHPKVRSD